MTKIVLFTGGRGCTSLIRAMLRLTDIELTLIVNAYDNGASTGMMRKFIPGYLGPSDFRKNLTYFLELFSPQQYALSELLNYRINEDLDDASVNEFISILHGSNNNNNQSINFIKKLQSLEGELREKIFEYLIYFFNYFLENSDKGFQFSDCALGNIIFAGAFLKNNDFEIATKELMTVFSSQTNAELLNITKGENRFLVGLKEDGQIIENEEKMVEGQSEIKYSGIYLLPQEFTDDELKIINKKSFEEKKVILENRHEDVYLSEKAREGILNCDIIIYGPGTQYSSLFPSYLTRGIGTAISSSKAKIKAFVVNINKDHDIMTYTAEDLIDNALNYLGDTENNNNLITHIFYNKKSNTNKDGVKLRKPFSSKHYSYKNAKILLEDCQHPNFHGIHNGGRTIDL